MKGREEGIKHALGLSQAQANDASASSLYVFPTDKGLFNYFINPKYKDFEKANRIIIINRFELLNLLIKEAFALSSPSELSAKTIKLLRASVQLHDMITGKREDLGHPDEAGGYYAILKPLVLDNSDVNHESYKELRKLLQVEDIKEKVEPTESPNLTTLMILAKSIETKNLLQKALDRRVLNLILDKIRKDIDLEVYEAHFETTEETILLKNMWCLSENMPSIKTNMTAHQMGTWPYDLVYPGFLTRSSNKEQKKDIHLDFYGGSNLQQTKVGRSKKENGKTNSKDKVKKKNDSSNHETNNITQLGKEKVEKSHKKELNKEGKEEASTIEPRQQNFDEIALLSSRLEIKEKTGEKREKKQREESDERKKTN